jgi:hypothetical protein
MNPTSCLFRITFCIDPVLSLTGALLFDDKICQGGALHWFGLRDVGIPYSRAIIQKTNDVSPAFLEHGSAEKITV